ncbi:hypothetical protein [Bacillus sp. B1-b2]|uniref:hypothetical protein n=1 Tax=Bacillus sp. B1-b2 TaxID=2653201 RepID=UPI00126272BC|nr:hypothetical protein [Bacillus sp. B1-b2]KAB7667739.1 hypothetical protein F9279_14530 [Bacillus sp. B1-b2]
MQTIRNRKTNQVQEIHLPFEKMDSVTMGRFLYLITPKKYGTGTYWLSIELAMKGYTADGQLVLKKFPLKNPDEIEQWIEQFQQHHVPLYYTNTFLKDLTLDDYDTMKKKKYPEETGEIELAYKTVNQEAPMNWDGKKIYR